MGSLVKNPQFSASEIINDIVQKGEIGGLRYFHRFRDLDNVLIDSSRESETFSDNVDAKLPGMQGLSQLRVWLDNWKSYGYYNYVYKSPLAEIEAGLSLVLSGPIVGVPYSLPSASTFCHIPMMIELDRDTSLTILWRNIFKGSDDSKEISVPGRVPFVFTIGPLEYENRYVVKLDIGLRKPIDFVFNTHVSENESNVIVLHCDRDVTDKSFCSDFMYDVVKRNKVPFSGITMNVHLNCRVDVTKLVVDLANMEGLSEAIEKSELEGKLTKQALDALKTCFECLQEEYRTFLTRPSYATVLKTGFRLLLP